MATQKEKSSQTAPLSGDLKAEQALGLIGLGLMQKMSNEGASCWGWSSEDSEEKADFNFLRQKLELTALAIETGAPLTTSEVALLLGAKPGSSTAERGGLTARRISRNVWKLSKSEQDSSYWRN